MSSSSIDFASIKKFVIQFQSRSISDPPISDKDFKNKMALLWTTLNYFKEVMHVDQNWNTLVDQKSYPHVVMHDLSVTSKVK